MLWIMGAATFIGGVLNTIQSGANATLGRTLHAPIVAAIVVTLANCVIYLAVAPFLGLGVPKGTAIAAVPWWGWIGGFLGGAYVLTAIYFADKLGAAIFTGLTVTAGIVTSVALDHFGLVGFAPHAASWPRLAGAALMLGGLALVSLF